MEWITPIRWAIGIAVLGFAVFVMIGNWLTLINLFNKKGSTSFIPLFGGCLAMVGILITPFPHKAYWFWTPLLLDWGCIPMWTWVGIAQLKKKKPTSEP